MRLLVYGGKPIALVQCLPNDILGDVYATECEICNSISPSEGAANFVEITEDEAAALIEGEHVDITERWTEVQQEDMGFEEDD